MLLCLTFFICRNGGSYEKIHLQTIINDGLNPLYRGNTNLLLNEDDSGITTWQYYEINEDATISG